MANPKDVIAVFVVPCVQFRYRFGGRGNAWTTQRYASDADQVFELTNGKSADYSMRARHAVFIEAPFAGRLSHSVFAMCATRQEAESCHRDLIAMCNSVRNLPTCLGAPTMPIADVQTIDRGVAA